MSDREMLKLAAKAAGLHRCENYYTDAAGNHVEWNPLHRNGDALRLAVELRLMDEVSVMNSQYESVNPLAATRRAIVRAAAEIGRQMP